MITAASATPKVPTTATPATTPNEPAASTKQELPTRELTSSSALLVKIDSRPDFSEIMKMPRGAERKQAAYDAIAKNAASSQAPFLKVAEELKESGAVKGYETLVSPNMLLVTPESGRKDDVIKAFGVDGVSRIYSNTGGAIVWPPALADAKKGASIVKEPTWGLEDPAETPEIKTAEAPESNPWGIGMIGAADAWAAGATGAGLVYGSIDTGVDANHEALRQAYRGMQENGKVEHDYNWVDFGRAPKAEPWDSQGHGTHTIGTVVGRTDKATIGVAPEAKFVAASGLSGKADAALRSLQWMQAPTRVDGSDPDASKAPDVVGLSWWMGRTDEDLFEESVQNLKAAGIEVVKSAGNRGPKDGTITSPGHYADIHTIAAVDKDGEVARFSSRGPLPDRKDGAATPSKPDFAAPGVDVLSSLPRDKYGQYSGTSMAQPHFSGAVLSILSKYPQLTHEQLGEVLKAGAVDKGDPGYDHAYGNGIINLPASLAAAEKLLGESATPVAAAAAS